MTPANREVKVSRKNLRHTERRKGVRCVDDSIFQCPSCGTSVAHATETTRRHQRFMRRLFDRQDELRKSLAFAIHEGLAQQLTGALLHFEGFLQLQEQPVHDVKDCFRIGLQLLRESICESRRLAGRLHPLILDSLGITLGIRSILRDMNRLDDGPESILRITGEIDRLPNELRNAVFRILHELLTNACAHSESEKIRVEVKRTRDRLLLEIEDWGIGFDMTRVNDQAFGLQEVCQRVALLDGDVLIDSAPGGGTRITVSFPIDEAALAAPGN